MSTATAAEIEKAKGPIEPMPLKIEVGKTYRNRQSETVGPMRPYNGGAYRFEGINHATGQAEAFTAEGFFLERRSLLR